jgi:hypothetical protein
MSCPELRPSVPARLGIDYPRLRKINPRLVYCGLTGYGDRGLLREKGGFDQVLILTGMAVFQGGGLTSRNWYWARCSTISPRRCSPAGCGGAVPAREERHRQYLSLSLLRSALTIQAGRLSGPTAKAATRFATCTGGLTGIHLTRDGTVSVHPTISLPRCAN